VHQPPTGGNYHAGGTGMRRSNALQSKEDREHVSLKKEAKTFAYLK
jgi:hypothetical protein